MRVLSPSRKAPKAGDLFTFQLPDDLFRFGRVITDEASAGGGSRLLLNYLYNVSSDRRTPPTDELTHDRLLVPPLMTNRLLWSRGYFETVASKELRASDVLARHVFCYRRPGGIVYFDEFGRRTFASDGPMATAGVSSYATIDDEVCEALGIPVAPDPNRR